MSATIMRRLAAVEAAAKPKEDCSPVCVVLNLPGGRQYAGGMIHGPGETSGNRVRCQVAVICDGPIQRGGLLSVCIEDECHAPSVLAEVFGEAEGEATR